MARRKGQSLVEFALCLPLLVTIAYAVVDFGFLFYQGMEATHAVREGARAGARGKSDTVVRQIVNGYHSVGTLRISTLQIAVEDAAGNQLPAGSRIPGSRLSVSLRYVVRPLTPLSVFASTVTTPTLTVRSVCRVEQP